MGMGGNGNRNSPSCTPLLYLPLHVCIMSLVANNLSTDTSDLGKDEEVPSGLMLEETLAAVVTCRC